MLLTKNVIVRWNSQNKKWYMDKGYIFTKMNDEFEVKVEDLIKGSSVYVEVKCDGKECTTPIANLMRWSDYLRQVKDNGKYYCHKCAMKLYGTETYRKSRLKNGKSFAQWCIENNRQDILDRWDYELNVNKNGNTIKPIEISYGSEGINGKGYWLKCLDNHKHISEIKNIKGFTGGRENSLKCNQCNTVAVTHSKFTKYFVNKDDADKYSYGSKIKAQMQCLDCGYKKYMTIRQLINYNFTCQKCGDGFSYPNKIGFNALEQLGINFETEYNPDWIKPKRYDFYFKLNNKKYILEMDGNFHYEDNLMNGQTKENSQKIDILKDKLANEHDIEVIRIDCIKSELEFIKQKLLDSKLNKLLDLSNINWLKLEEFALSNRVKEACNLWSKGIKNAIEIARIMKISKRTSIIYLKQGTKLGWCSYDAKEATEISLKNRRISVICLNTKEVFNSATEASVFYGVSNGGIISCCKGKTKSRGKHPITGEKLKWMYYEDYLKMNPIN